MQIIIMIMTIIIIATTTISGWSLHLNVNCKPINLLHDDVVGNGDDFGFGNDFLGTIPKAQFVKGKN